MREDGRRRRRRRARQSAPRATCRRRRRRRRARAANVSARSTSPRRSRTEKPAVRCAIRSAASPASVSAARPSSAGAGAAAGGRSGGGGGGGSVGAEQRQQQRLALARGGRRQREERLEAAVREQRARQPAALPTSADDEHPRRRRAQLCEQRRREPRKRRARVVGGPAERGGLGALAHDLEHVEDDDRGRALRRVREDGGQHARRRLLAVAKQLGDEDAVGAHALLGDEPRREPERRALLADARRAADEHVAAAARREAQPPRRIALVGGGRPQPRVRVRPQRALERRAVHALRRWWRGLRRGFRRPRRRRRREHRRLRADQAPRVVVGVVDALHPQHEHAGQPIDRAEGAAPQRQRLQLPAQRGGAVLVAERVHRRGDVAAQQADARQQHRFHPWRVGCLDELDAASG